MTESRANWGMFKIPPHIWERYVEQEKRIIAALDMPMRSEKAMRVQAFESVVLLLADLPDDVLNRLIGGK